jgi:hypothetical protein
MHMIAIDQTRRLRGIDTTLDAPFSVIYRRFRAAADSAPTAWEKKLLAFVWTVVSEISINAYLTLLSRDTTIQVSHKLVTHLHDRDEFSHSSLVAEVAKSVYVRMSDSQRRAFVRSIPVALRAFSEHDFSAWRAILDRVGIQRRDEIIEDCVRDTSDKTLVRDFSGVRALVEDLGVLDDLDFDFGAR